MATLTERDRELLEVLTRRVRVLSVAQIARTWWPEKTGAERAAETRLRALERTGLVALERLFAKPTLHLERPTAAWQPGGAPPAFSDIAKHCQTRHPGRAAMTLCAIATEIAAETLGGRGGRFPRDAEVNHDLELAEVYLLMRRLLPTRARSWVSEEAIYGERAPEERAQKLPDARVTDGTHQTAVEYVGTSYTADDLEAFHRWCDAAQLAYELW